MDDSARAQLESRSRALCDEGDYAAAATALVRGYGPEILGFLAALHRSEDDAGQCFSEVSEALWRGLPRFGWDSSARTWAYAIARNVSSTFRRDRGRAARRVQPLSDSKVQQVAQQVRTQTTPFLRTEEKTRLRALRDSLPEADRMLLVLRVDRGLAWNDLARILTDPQGDGSLEGQALAREAARLRKRFQLVKARLRELARREGLLE